MENRRKYMSDGPTTENGENSANFSKRPAKGVLEGTRTQARIDEAKPLTKEEYEKGEFLRQFEKTGDIDRKKAATEINEKFNENLSKEKEEREREEALKWKYAGGQKKEPQITVEETVARLKKINEDREARNASSQKNTAEPSGQKKDNGVPGRDDLLAKMEREGQIDPGRGDLLAKMEREGQIDPGRGDLLARMEREGQITRSDKTREQVKKPVETATEKVKTEPVNEQKAATETKTNPAAEGEKKENKPPEQKPGQKEPEKVPNAEEYLSQIKKELEEKIAKLRGPGGVALNSGEIRSITRDFYLGKLDGCFIQHRPGFRGGIERFFAFISGKENVRIVNKNGLVTKDGKPREFKVNWMHQYPDQELIDFLKSEYEKEVREKMGKPVASPVQPPENKTTEPKAPEPMTPPVSPETAKKSDQIPPEIKLGNAIWANKDHDQPIKITGYMGKDLYGNDYVTIEGYKVGIPLSEIKYPGEKTAAATESTKKAEGVPNQFPPGVKLGEAIWANKEHDQPIKITGYMGKDLDGNDYVTIEGYKVGIPLSEIKYPENNSPKENPNPTQPPITPTP